MATRALERGERSRDKVIRIDGLTGEQIRGLLMTGI
jgi:uncharacterized protein YggU (UPF0235/DUF167 family)